MKKWIPGFYASNGAFIPYEKAWYCNKNKIIHGNEKEMLNCKHCNSENDKS